LNTGFEELSNIFKRNDMTIWPRGVLQFLALHLQNLEKHSRRNPLLSEVTEKDPHFICPDNTTRPRGTVIAQPSRAPMRHSS
jgi:hypothetical protein